MNNQEIFHDDESWMEYSNVLKFKPSVRLISGSNLLDLKGKSILITGGTGSFGKKMVEVLLRVCPKIGKIIIYSRDEFKQSTMMKKFPQKDHSPMRYILGDVRDAAGLERACEGVDYVIHAAALKQVPMAEYNPFEFVKTNVVGANNVISACLKNKSVKKVIALSTDKAVSPINLYGATKLVSDKLFLAANNHKGKRDLSFSVVRYGNVLCSRGSVVPFFMEEKEKGILPLPITDERMTRFNITLNSAVHFTLNCLSMARGREIFIPKLPAYKILDLAKAVDESCETIDVGIRQGEKIDEDLITTNDALTTIDCRLFYIVLPLLDKETFQEYCSYYRGSPVEEGFRYNSGELGRYLNPKQLKNLIEESMEDIY